MKSNSGTVNMTTGDHRKLILSFALPILFGHLFQQFYNMADSLIVGNLVGAQALAAVASTSSLIYLFIGFFMGFSNGSGIVIARAIGLGDRKATGKAVHTAVCVGIFSSILLTVGGLLFAPVLLKIMDTPDDIIAQARTYLMIYFGGASGMVMYNTFTGILQAGGDSKDPLKYLIISSVINIVLDFVFIAFFKLDVAGAAIATVISQFFSAFLALRKLLTIDDDIRVIPSEIRVDRSVLKDIIRNGMPTALQGCVIDLSNVLIQSYINSFGSAAVAGIGAYSRVEGFGFLPVTAFSMALSTYISQNIGAGKPDRVKRGMFFGLAAGVACAQFIGLGFVFFGRPLIGLFVRDPEVIEIGCERARICGTFYFLVAFSHLTSAVMRGIGKPTVPMIVMLVCWCAIRVLVFMTIGQTWHYLELTHWIYPFTWSLSTIVYLCYMAVLKKKGQLYGPVGSRSGANELEGIS